MQQTKILTTKIESPTKQQLHADSLGGSILFGSKRYLKLKDWRKRNPEKLKEQAKRSRIKNREKNNDRVKKWQQANRDKTNKYFIEWGKKNPGKLEAKKLRARNKTKGINLSYEDYIKMCSSQNNLCSICGKKEIAKHSKTGTTNILSIDHCHKTKKVRGLLCKKCNSAIGFFEDDLDIVKKAVKYLQKHL